MKLRLASSITALAVLTVSLFTAASSADASIITMQLTGTITNTEYGPVFGQGPSPIPFDFSLTYDTTKGSQVAFVGGDPHEQSFYGYSGAGITAVSMTLGPKTWTLDSLGKQAVSGQEADFWTNADLTLGAPSALAVYFGDGEGSLKLGSLYTKTSNAIFKLVTIRDETVPNVQRIVTGNYILTSSVTPAAVPEPASLLCVGTGLVGLVLRRRSSKRH
jgi:hypothetical protein